MLSQELELVYESVEDSGAYEGIAGAIEPEWIEQALLATDSASPRNKLSGWSG
jgi:hypothetical protein